MAKSSSPTEVGTVLSLSRRSASVLAPHGEILDGQIASRAIDVTVGDEVRFSRKGATCFIEEALPPTNTLRRSYFGQVKRVAANVDRVFIGAAVHPLFNTTFIDRLLCVTTLEQIDATLVVNKVDLGLRDTQALIGIYQELGVDLVLASALQGDGMDLIREQLADPELHLAVLAGISGVGKSTIVNQLIPDAHQRTAEVSVRTGQGKQTTAQPIGHLYQRQGSAPVILVDLPGIQRFGVSYLPKDAVQHGFPEILAHGANCEYSDCLHAREGNCAVQAAFEEGKIAESRYRSYLDILIEIEEASEF